MAINKSAEKTLKILELIAKYPEGITLSEIYKALDMPKASVYDILQALYKEDAIYYKDPRQKNYVIGSKVFAIGQAYTKNSNFINFASPFLRKFADKYGVTVFACKRLGDKLVFIYKYESINTKIQTTDVGLQQPLYENIAGRTLLAFASPERQEELLSSILRNDFGGIKNIYYEELLNDIANIKELGYGLDDGKTLSYMYSLAVPVFNHEGKASGAILFSRVIDNEDERVVTSQIKEFRDIASFVSAKQGYKGEANVSRR